MFVMLPNTRLWGELVAAQRRKGRPSPEGATTAAYYAFTKTIVPMFPLLFLHVHL